MRSSGARRAPGSVRGVLRAASIGTLPGEPYMHPTIGAACAAIVHRRDTRPLVPVLATLAAASIGAILAHHAVKLVYRRPRPAGALARGKTEPAFPSGHTTDATAVLVTGAYLLARQGLATPSVVAAAALVLALCTGVSRVLLGWHWAHRRRWAAGSPASASPHARRGSTSRSRESRRAPTSPLARYGFAAVGSCSSGVAPPVTCGICPFHFFVSSYCTSVGVMLCASSCWRAPAPPPRP